MEMHIGPTRRDKVRMVSLLVTLAITWMSFLAVANSRKPDKCSTSIDATVPTADVQVKYLDEHGVPHVEHVPAAVLTEAAERVKVVREAASAAPSSQP